MPDVSVIIVSWNAKELLISCLNSFIDSQGGYTQEIIVVDNASSDGSPEATEREFTKVRLIKNDTNLGFAKANNIAIRESTGRYVCLVNSDIIVLDDGIEKLVQFMDGNTDIGMAGPKIIGGDGCLQVSCRYLPTLWNNFCQAAGLHRLFPKSSFFSDWQMNNWAHDATRDVDALSGCFWIVRRSAMEKVGLLDERFFIYGEDLDWCKRFHEAGWRVVFCPGSQAIHYGAASSANAPVHFFLQMQKADLQYWRKHHGLAQMFVYALIVALRHMLRLPFRFLRLATLVLRRKSGMELALCKVKQSVATLCWLCGLRRI